MWHVIQVKVCTTNGRLVEQPLHTITIDRKTIRVIDTCIVITIVIYWWKLCVLVSTFGGNVFKTFWLQSTYWPHFVFAIWTWSQFNNCPRDPLWATMIWIQGLNTSNILLNFSGHLNLILPSVMQKRKNIHTYFRSRQVRPTKSTVMNSYRWT